jgi:hypothetical protein
MIACTETDSLPLPYLGQLVTLAVNDAGSVVLAASRPPRQLLVWTYSAGERHLRQLAPLPL